MIALNGGFSSQQHIALLFIKTHAGESYMWWVWFGTTPRESWVFSPIIFIILGICEGISPNDLEKFTIFFGISVYISYFLKLVLILSKIYRSNFNYNNNPLGKGWSQLPLCMSRYETNEVFRSLILDSKVKFVPADNWHGATGKLRIQKFHHFILKCRYMA